MGSPGQSTAASCYTPQASVEAGCPSTRLGGRASERKKSFRVLSSSCSRTSEFDVGQVPSYEGLSIYLAMMLCESNLKGWGKGASVGL